MAYSRALDLQHAPTSHIKVELAQVPEDLLGTRVGRAGVKIQTRALNTQWADALKNSAAIRAHLDSLKTAISTQQQQPRS